MAISVPPRHFLPQPIEVVLTRWWALKSVAFNATAGTSYTIDFSVVGSTLSAKVWQTGTQPPTSWMVTATDSSLSSGNCGIVVFLQNNINVDITSFLATQLS